MKSYYLLLAVLIGLLLVQCSGKPDVAPASGYDLVSRNLMQTVAPQLVGTWTLRQVHVSRQNIHAHAQIPLTRDTLFQNFATLTIRRATTPRTTPENAQYPEFEGTLVFRSKSYPVYFQLIANPERVVQQQGPQALLLLETNFQSGTRVMEPEEVFLRNLGFLGENYSLELVDGKPAMIWRGLNRGVDRVEFSK